MKIKVTSAKGAATSKEVSLSKEVFGIEPNDHAIYLDVKQHLANRRQGTHKAKERAEITGSTKKLRSKKVQVVLVLVVLSLVRVSVVVVFLGLVQEIITSN